MLPESEWAVTGTHMSTRTDSARLLLTMISSFDSLDESTKASLHGMRPSIKTLLTAVTAPLSDGAALMVTGGIWSPTGLLVAADRIRCSDISSRGQVDTMAQGTAETEIEWQLHTRTRPAWTVQQLHRRLWLA